MTILAQTGAISNSHKLALAIVIDIFSFFFFLKNKRFYFHIKADNKYDQAELFPVLFKSSLTALKENYKWLVVQHTHR